MKVIRWITFILAFILFITIAQSLAEFLFNWLIGIVFPIESFWEFVGGSIAIPFIGCLIFLFVLGSITVMKIAPKQIVGARILLALTIVLYGAHYLKSFHDISGVRMFFDALTFLTIVFSSVSNSEDVPENKEKSHPHKGDKDEYLLVLAEERSRSRQFDEDMEIIYSLGDSLENMPSDRLPKNSDLKYPVERIKDAVARLLANEKLSGDHKRAIQEAHSYLFLFKYVDHSSEDSK